MANIILQEKIRNPQNQNDWITPFYVTNDNNIHINGFLATKGAVDTNNIKSNAITADKIPEKEIGTSKIADDAITTDKIYPGAVTQDSLDSGAVSTTKIINSAVTADKINSSAVTTDKIDNGAVTGVKIQNESITPDHLASAIATITNPSDPEGTGLYNGSFKLLFNY